jgi:phosphoribosylglycinamide formyltransferase-1
MKRLAVLASGHGSLLQSVLDATAAGELLAVVAVVVSDRYDSGAVRRAAAHRVPLVVLPHPAAADRRAREQYGAQLASVIEAFSPDLVVMAGWKWVLGRSYLDRLGNRTVNAHPALLPDEGHDLVMTSMGGIPALRGDHAVRDALRAGLLLTGATVHYVTERVDAGKPIARCEVRILPGDTVESLHERIKQAERRLLPQAIQLALDEAPKCGSERVEAHERGGEQQHGATASSDFARFANRS